MRRRVDFAVIGTGAAGALVSIHLARAAPTSSVALVGRGPPGLGIAYSTLEPEHLLNVPADRMSAFADAPDHFAAWLHRQGHAYEGSDYAPRALFGAYIQDLLAAVPRRQVRYPSQATAIASTEHGLALELEDGEQLEADVAILATGVLMPPIPPLLQGIAQRAWEPGAFDGIPPDAAVLLLGTGLSMVDAALALSWRGHRGHLFALSRHGLMPVPHAPGARPVSTFPVPVERVRGRLRHIVRAVRNAAREEEARGGDWRTVVDGLRPLTMQIWSSLDLTDRKRFLRHVRAFWDVHRHRMAPETARELYRLRRRGQLSLHAGRLASVERRQGQLSAAWRERWSGRRVEAEVSRVIDCASAAGLTEAESPLIQSAEAAGLVRLDPLGLGIETSSVGAVVGREGVSSNLFAIGALRRFERWESTAIPELRAQAAALARYLVERFRGSRYAARVPAW
jgi:uncharacterized NAD(P)/FAD-binding protein YdhS